MSQDNDKDDQNTRQESTEGPFSVSLGEPAQGPEDSDIGTIFVNSDYQIRRFVSTVTDLIRVESFNINYALEDFTRRLEYDEIKTDIDNVRKNHVRLKRKVREKSGRWYMMELRPYFKEKIEGVVVTFVDITELQNTKEELARKIEENNELQREIISNDVTKRWNIGQYLHDELAQLLVSAQLLGDSLKSKVEKGDQIRAEEIEKLNDILEQSVADVRNLSHDVIPINLEEKKGMIGAFNELAQQLEKIHDICCELEYDNAMDAIDDAETATHLYQTAHEAARNAAVHGEAENVKITLKSDDEYLYLDISDDGTGFSDSSKEKGGGMGISIMRHRMELIGGTLEVKNTSEIGDTGVTISCRIPVDKDKKRV